MNWTKFWETLVSMREDILQGLWDTFIMLAISVPISVIVGGALGLWLFASTNRSLFYNRMIGIILGRIIDTVRAFPFVILLVYLTEPTRFLFNVAIGPIAASFGLSIAGAFFYARLIEQNLREVSKGVIEAAVSMGASPLQIIFKVLLSEARSGIVSSITVLTIALLSYSAAAGMMAGGGIGDLAIQHGYHRSQYELMHFLVIILVIIVIVIQDFGSYISRKLDKR